MKEKIRQVSLQITENDLFVIEVLKKQLLAKDQQMKASRFLDYPFEFIYLLSHSQTIRKPLFEMVFDQIHSGSHEVQTKALYLISHTWAEKGLKTLFDTFIEESQ